MDLCELLKGVKNVNDYITITQDLVEKHGSQITGFNMSTVLALKNIRSLEIEYFNKCDDMGAAFIIFERLLRTPPSKSWSLLGKELISLLQYWLDAIRKHLISHHIHWWSFMEHILGFLKEMKPKSPLLTDMLVEKLTESLLELASSGRVTVDQRHKILFTFNQCCTDSSREIRLAMRSQFEHYFIKLSTTMASCGHFPTQYNIMEILLRWLLPRQDLTVKRQAAAKWFPSHLYQCSTVDLFLQRPWINFLQDARDFLNCHNELSGLVTSVLCKRLIIGNTVLLSATERKPFWLDINTGNNSLTVLFPYLDNNHTLCETLTICHDIVTDVKLYRESREVLLSVSTVVPVTMHVHRAAYTGTAVFTVSMLSAAALDRAMRAMFIEKYQVLLDIESVTCESPSVHGSSKRTCADGGTQFTRPSQERRRKQSGYAMRSVYPYAPKSPSSISTNSLAQLHDKLEALPRYSFDKEPVKVSAYPDLSSVTEVSEQDDISASFHSSSTFKLQKCAILNRSFYNYERKVQPISDGEIVRKNVHVKDFRGSQSEGDNIDRTDSPKKRIPQSSLFRATINSANKSLLNSTIEHLPKDKDLDTDCLIEMIVKEALKANNERDQQIDSGINTGDVKKTQDDQESSEAIENTPFTEKTKILPNRKPECTIISKSSTDESNTEAISDTQISYVSVRKRNHRRRSTNRDVKENQGENSHDKEAVEKFFAQHITENQAGEVVISPTLARKINETSSESNDFEYLISDTNFNNICNYVSEDEIIEFLNDMVGKVCSEMEKCTQFIHDKDVSDDLVTKKKGLKDVTNTKKVQEHKPKGKRQPMKVVNNKSVKKPKVRKAKKNKNKLELEPAKMSPLIEVDNENNVISKASTSPDSKELDMPVTRKKRKLYSPKDDDKNLGNSEKQPNPIEVQKYDVHEKVKNDTDIEENIPLAKVNSVNTILTPKVVATCYKDLEKDRQAYRTRVRRSKSKAILLSPKTIKSNDVFDRLKETIESNEKITVTDVKDYAVFNFSSDDDDEDFKIKKIELQKRTSTTIDSGNSIISTRRGRNTKKVNYCKIAQESDEDVSSNQTTKKTVAKRNRAKRQCTKRSTKKDFEIQLEDQGMRATPFLQLNTSLERDKPCKDDKNKKNGDGIEPNILAPEVEIITEDNSNDMGSDGQYNSVAIKNVDKIQEKQITESKDIKKSEKANINDSTQEKKNKATKNTKKNEKALKKKITESVDASSKEGDRTTSPLPVLVVETMHDEHKTRDDSLTANMIQRFQKIYKEGPGTCDETNNTQNLLSDIEIKSPQINVTEEFNKIEKNIAINKEDPKARKYKADSWDDEANCCVSAIQEVTIAEVHREFNESDNSSKKKKPSLSLKSKGTSDSDKELTIKNSYKPVKLEQCYLTKPKEKTKSQSVKQEIICLDTDTYLKPRSQLSKRSSQNVIETINISEVSNGKSEKSIATDGITGHGDVNETPPNPDDLKENFMPRELEDMDQSLKEYFISLGKQLTRESSFNERKTKVNKSGERSPVVRLCRLSSEQISVWSGNYNAEKLLPSRRDTESECSDLEHVVKSSVKKTSSMKPINDSDDSPRPRKSLERKCKQAENQFSSLKLKVNSQRKSFISPVKLFDESLPSFKMVLESTDEINNSQNETFHETKKSNYFLRETVRQKKECRSSSPENKKYFLKYFVGKNTIKSSQDQEATPKSSISSSTRIGNSRRCTVPKRSFIHKDEVESKRRKIEIESISSGPSISSVDDWLSKIPAANKKAVNINLSARDIIQTVTEKLDTTLAEIHLNSSKNFIHLFVEAQQRLGEMKTKRHEEFVALDQRLQRNEDEFMDWLKQSAVTYIRNDISKRQAMVDLLKEDTQAALDAINRQSHE